MVELDGRTSCLEAVRVLRVTLVDELEAGVDPLLDVLVGREVFTRDDREEVMCRPGPRARVRKVLDILECKGEEAARIFFTVKSRQVPRDRSPTPSTDYRKVREKHRVVLQRRSESMLSYNNRHGEKILFSEHYVNLLLVDGHQALEVKRHEVLSFGQKRLSLQQRSAPQKKITPPQLFLKGAEKRSIKKVLVTGVAGIGKTVLVQKMLFDFGRNEEYFGFDFVLQMSFRDLNLIEKPTNLRDLVLRRNRHLAKDIDIIFANEDRLLIILDGFDEFRHYRSCDSGEFVTEPEEEAEVKDVLGSLLQGELLPNASVMLTSRPTAISHIPVDCIDRFVLITGFSLAEVQDFFVRYFQDAALADRMFASVSANELMLTLCYIPAFCYIVCCILKEGENLCGESPKTMTDIYVQYLVALLRSHTQSRSEARRQNQRAGAVPELSDAVMKLGRLAFQKLLEHQTLFYSSDDDVAALEGSSLISTFLDKTITQEPGCTEEVFSFAHLTIQEFFAALYCAVSDQPFPEAIQGKASPGEETNGGPFDLFSRFLSGIFSQRNDSFLSRQVGLRCRKDKADSYRQKILSDLTALCESGAQMLNSLHCLFEQQDSLLASEVQPSTLRVNVSDDTLSQMDYNAIKYFLNHTKGRIAELDLTGTGLKGDTLRQMLPQLPRCERLWLGENNLDMDAVEAIADVLKVSDNLTHLGIGWSNIGDAELNVVSRAVQVKKNLRELWMEGNRVSCGGLRSLSDLTPYPLKTIVAIWNDLCDLDRSSLCSHDSFTVNFTKDGDMWEAWGEWVLRRCEVSCNEKLVTVLHKMCNIPSGCLEAQWAKNFYGQLSELIARRIERCTEDDMCRKLKKFDYILNI